MDKIPPKDLKKPDDSPLDWLNSLERLGINFGLERVHAILDLLSNPEKNLVVIHITGTNGKGSVAAFISKILEVAGYMVGLYTSPHLQDVRERIQLNGKLIGNDELLSLLRQIRIFNQTLDLKLTYFEVLTVAALAYFREKNVNYAVLEAGMGGRLDATNVVENVLVSIITNIDYEHTDYLGTMLSQIAYEKAGIIRDKGAVVTGAERIARETIATVCASREAKLYALGKEIKFTKDQEFNYTGINQNFSNLEIGLLGEHQYFNAALSIAAIEILISKGAAISEKHIRRGLKEVYWPGRMELFGVNIFDKKLKVVLEGAHNPQGMEILRKNLVKKVIPHQKLILVVGIFKDKDADEMFKQIAPAVSELIITQSSNNPRACPAEELKPIARHYIAEEKIKVFSDLSSALKEAFYTAGEKDLICIAGSLYLVGEVRTLFMEMGRKTA
ncbi:MAG: folylpolyglutamate synthase/dihydrofolate synthase family protein [Elusimicrobiota bacterium]